MNSLTTTSPTTTSAVTTSAPATTSIADAIAALREGKVVSVIGRITEVEDRPMNICTSDGIHDALYISSLKGNPHLFLTMTANPRWAEIRSLLPPHQ